MSYREAQERLKAKRQVSEQQEWLQLILTSIGDGVIATDFRGRIKFLNHPARAASV